MGKFKSFPNSMYKTMANIIIGIWFFVSLPFTYWAVWFTLKLLIGS